MREMFGLGKQKTIGQKWLILIAALIVIFLNFFLIPFNGVQAEHAEAGRGGAEGEDLGAGQHHQE